jgi:hypothetical protein
MAHEEESEMASKGIIIQRTMKVEKKVDEAC